MALAIGLPALAGRADLGLLASTGALTSLYLTSMNRVARLRRLPVLQALLLAAAALGALCAGSPVLAAVVLAAVTIGGAVLVTGLAVGPPGLVFVVLTTGVTIRLTAPPAIGGAGLDARVVLAAEAAGCLLALALAALALLLPGVRRADRQRPVEPVAFRLDPAARIVVLRLAIAAVVATAVSAPLGVHRVYWVLLAAVAALQAGRSRALTAARAVNRVLGTLAGLLLFAAVALLQPAGLLLALVAAVLQFVTELVVVRHYGVALVFITPLALTIADAGAHQSVGAVMLERLGDTALGAAVALAVLVGDLLVERTIARRGGARATPGDRP
jgi:hypothetical protein